MTHPDTTQAKYRCPECQNFSGVRCVRALAGGPFCLCEECGHTGNEGEFKILRCQDKNCDLWCLALLKCDRCNAVNDYEHDHGWKPARHTGQEEPTLIVCHNRMCLRCDCFELPEGI